VVYFFKLWSLLVRRDYVQHIPQIHCLRIIVSIKNDHKLRFVSQHVQKKNNKTLLYQSRSIVFHLFFMSKMHGYTFIEDSVPCRKAFRHDLGMTSWIQRLQW